MNSWETQHRGPPSCHPSSHWHPAIITGLCLSQSFSSGSVSSANAENHDGFFFSPQPSGPPAVITKKFFSFIHHEIQHEQIQISSFEFQIRALKALTFHFKSQAFVRKNVGRELVDGGGFQASIPRVRLRDSRCNIKPENRKGCVLI